MKTSLVVSVVVAAHVVVVLALMGMQGCGTTRSASSLPPEPKMPGPVVEPIPQPIVAKPVLPISQPVAKSWPDEMTTYTVQKGDSISLIAHRFHVSQAEVLALNHMSNANKLKVGQSLKLPGKVDLNAPKPVRKAKPAARTTTAAKHTAPAATPDVASGSEYVVKAGDVLSRIAVHNGTTVAALRQVNNLHNDKIVVGQKLKLPGAAETAPAPTPVAVAPVATPPAPEVTAPDAPAPDAPAPAEPAAAAAGDADSAQLTEAPPAAPVAGAAPSAATSFRSHTVEQGEDLFSVSLLWNVSVEELQRANSVTGTALTVGQVLQVPMHE